MAAHLSRASCRELCQFAGLEFRLAWPSGVAVPERSAAKEAAPAAMADAALACWASSAVALAPSRFAVVCSAALRCPDAQGQTMNSAATVCAKAVALPAAG